MNKTDIKIGDMVWTVKGRGVVSAIDGDKLTVDLNGDHGSYWFHKDTVLKITTNINHRTIC